MLCAHTLTLKLSVQLQSCASLLFFVLQQQQLRLCYDVIGCWLWNTWGNENLIELEESAAHICWISSVAWSSVFFFKWSFICLSLVIMLNYKIPSWNKSCLGASTLFIYISKSVVVDTYWCFYCFLLSWQRTASLSQLPVEDLRDPLPPHWRCYMSPQGRRYYVNTASNGTGNWNSSGDILYHIYDHLKEP